MENYQIARQFSMLSKLMEIHGEDSFRAKSYSIAAFTIEKLPVTLAGLPQKEIFSLKGIGSSLGKKIIEILDRGHLHALEEFMLKTPAGILEIMQIKGLGPKKIHTIWKEMEIESLGELLHACTENRLARIKGFGEKTQKSVEESIQFILNAKGSNLFAEMEDYVLSIDRQLRSALPKEQFELTGAFRRKLPVLDAIEWVSTANVEEIRLFMEKTGFEEQESGAEFIHLKNQENSLLKFYTVRRELFYSRLFETSCSEEFRESWNSIFPTADDRFESEEQIFQIKKIPFIPPQLREFPEIISQAAERGLPNLIEPEDIRGIIHSHSTWSDGSFSIEEMAKACIQRGLEYLVISDHSQSAFYANGLKEESILAQHAEIDVLNKQLAPFKIFKSIESDILNDGSLDYNEEILKSFDLVIASVHSNLKMPIEKATERLLSAIKNPFTTILGHLTGRLLLSRPGYPIDHKKIIEACAKYKVVIEINANPRRLDIDWSFLSYALDLGVMISVNPDAHDIEEFDNIRYGVFMAQKGGLSSKQNLSSFTLKEFSDYLIKVKQQKPGVKEV